VKAEEVRHFEFGSIVEPPKYSAEQVLWERIRHGPSALEDSAIRRVVAKGEFKLRHVQTRVSRKPVLIDSRKLAPVFPAIVSFDKRRLNKVETRVSHKPIVDRSLSAEMKTAILAFPKRAEKLQHVEPRVTYKPIVDRSLSCEAITAIKTFPQVQLNHVEPKVTYRVVVKQAAEEKKIAPAPAAPAPAPKIEEKKPAQQHMTAEQLKMLVSNVEQLAELGFGDKKATFALLRNNGNDLVGAIETLLSN